MLTRISRTANSLCVRHTRRKTTVGGSGEERTRDPERTKARILKAATDLFMKVGPTGCSLDDISREAGVNRMIWGKDGSLYLGMMGRGPGGNWNWRNTVAGLQKITPTGKSVFEMHSVSITGDGFVVHFTQPVARQWLADPDHYTLWTWTYTPSIAQK